MNSDSMRSLLDAIEARPSARAREIRKVSAGERIHRAQFVAHLGVHHAGPVRCRRAAGGSAAPTGATASHAVLHQQVEVVALGDAAELVAAGRTDQFVQAAPSAELGAGSLQFGQAAPGSARGAGCRPATGCRYPGRPVRWRPGVRAVAAGCLPAPRGRFPAAAGDAGAVAPGACFQCLLAGDLLFAVAAIAPAIASPRSSERPSRASRRAVVEVVLAFAPGLPVGLKALELIPLALPLLLQVFQGFGESQLFLAQRIQGAWSVSTGLCAACAACSSDSCQSRRRRAGPGERRGVRSVRRVPPGPFPLPDGLRCVARRFASVASSIHRSAA